MHPGSGNNRNSASSHASSDYIEVPEYIFVYDLVICNSIPFFVMPNPKVAT